MNSPVPSNGWATSVLELRTLGSLGLRMRGGPELLSVLSRPKYFALLCRLVMARGFVRRDLLLPLFWPESDDAHARASLRQAIHFLRQSLGERVLISRGDEELKVDSELLWCDAVAFDQAVEEDRREEAFTLYSGDFLSGFFVAGAPELDQWLDTERERLRRRAIANAWSLAERCAQSGAASAAAEFGRTAVALAPADDALLRRYMLLLERCGDASGAVAAYESYARRLQTEYDMKPAAEAQALAKEIAARRPPVAVDDAVIAVPPALSPPQSTRGFTRWRRWAKIAVPAVLIVDGLFYVALKAPSAPIDPGKQIILADFANHTRDSTIAVGVTQMLTTDLAQSNYLRVAGSQRIGAVLKRMGRDHVSRLTPELAREIAVREGLHAVLQGDVVQLGSGYAITAQLVTADSGRVLLAYREEARRPDQVMKAVDRLSVKLRRHTGESLRAVRKQQPLAAVTTSSLDALKAYSAALQVERQATWEDRPDLGSANQDIAIKLLERAIALDSTFAAAYLSYGSSLYWATQQAAANQALTRAFQLRNRLTERERLLTEGTYYSFVRRDFENAIARFQQMLQMNPQDQTALRHLTILYLWRKDYARAADCADREWALHGGVPDNAWVAAMLGAGRIARADSFLQYYAAREKTAGQWHVQLIRLEQTRGNYHAVDTLFNDLQLLADRSTTRARVLPTRLLGSWKIWRGAYSDGSALIRSSFLPPNSPASILAVGFNLARYDVFVRHDATGARRRLDSVLRAQPFSTLPLADRPYLNYAQAYAFAGDYAQASGLLREYESAQAPLQTDDYKYAAAYNVKAIISAAQGNVARAREIMAQGDREIGCWESAPWLRLGRAVVEELAANQDSIIAAWERFVAVPSCWVITSYDGAYASAMAFAHAHERLAQLYDARGDVTRAAAHYQSFIETWSTPDPALQPRVNAAKHRLAQLRYR